MSVQDLKKRIREDLIKHHPSQAAALKKEGTLEASTLATANMVQEEKDLLMRQGYQDHEAEEVAMQPHLKPEDEDAQPDWEKEELEELARKYHANPPPTVTNEDENP